MVPNIPRYLHKNIVNRLKPNKAVLIYGARRVGKTALIKSIIAELPQDEVLFVNGEDQIVAAQFAIRTITNYKLLIGSKKYLIIDEAQNIERIGSVLKLIVDEIEGIHVLVSGSSVFDLSNKLGEPLVGRQTIFQMHPIAQCELKLIENTFDSHGLLEVRLIYGCYPELFHISSQDEKAEYLESIINSYLLKDILVYDGIKKSNKLMDLLRLIAFQIGQEVSIDELATNLKGISRNTVESYLDLLEKVFVIYKVSGFSRNLRKEIVKTSRYYFYDNGIRNALIRNFNSLRLRNDVGQLWENHMMIERRKFNESQKKRVYQYFWRTYDQQEIDLIEEEDGELRAFEFKWNPKKNAKAPAGWAKNYPDTRYQVISPSNFLGFIS
jgi:predicted AAA+ superfamily ATPase